MPRKSLALLFMLVLTSLAGASAQNLLTTPTASVYDPVRDCYYVSNQSGGSAASVVKFDSNRVQSVFIPSTYARCTGLLIKGDTLYMEAGTDIVAFDLNTREELWQMVIPGARRLYDVAGDDAGNLYLSDYDVDKVFKLNIATRETSTFAAGMDRPCGMYHQRSHNRMILVSGAEVSYISAMSLTDSSVTELVPVGVGDMDRLAADDEGNIYVSDWTHDVVYKFDPEFTSYVAVFIGLRDPSGISIDMRRKIMAVPEQNSARVTFREISVGAFNRVWDRAPVDEPALSDSRGVSWVDYDNDGYDDLFVLNAGAVPGLSNRLFHNNTDGTFTRITSGGIVTGDGVSQSATWADYDNDGYIDCFVANAEDQYNFLYHNIGGGEFERNYAEPVGTRTGYSTAASWADYNLDGLVDLFVAGRGRNSLFRNEGGSFTDVTSAAPVTEAGQASGVGWADIDNDLDPDLFVPRETGGSSDANDRLYRNSGGTFTQAANPPIGVDGAATYGGSWGDYDNDGDLDLFVPTAADGNDYLYRNDGDGTFSAVSEGPVVTSGGNSFSSCWADLNNDGFLDLFVANSYTGSGETGNFLFWNNGDGTFSRETIGQIVTDTAFCGSVAAGDYDQDGDLDLYVTQSGGRVNMLYRNNGNGSGWIKVTCVGRQSNSSAIGAKVKVKAVINGNPVWQMREISAQTGFGAQSSLTAHFGLFDTWTIDTIMVQWPSGVVSVLENVSASQSLIVYEKCCQGRVGDSNGAGGDEPTIGDVSALIDAKFITGICDGVLKCRSEADVNRSGGSNPSCDDITIGDITMLVDYLFITGESAGLADCL